MSRIYRPFIVLLAFAFGSGITRADVDNAETLDVTVHAKLEGSFHSGPSRDPKGPQVKESDQISIIYTAHLHATFPKGTPPWRMAATTADVQVSVTGSGGGSFTLTDPKTGASHVYQASWTYDKQAPPQVQDTLARIDKGTLTVNPPSVAAWNVHATGQGSSGQGLGGQMASLGALAVSPVAISAIGRAGLDAIHDKAFLDKLTAHFDPTARSFSITGQAAHRAALPAPGGALSGTIEIDYTVSVNARPADLEAVMAPDPGDNYDRWLPSAGADEDAAGRTLKVTVEVENKDRPGVATDRKVTQLRFELEDVSKEPGICINAPKSGAKTAFDLNIDAKSNTSLHVAADGQSATTSAGPRSSVTITSHDWGAYGKLQITATLDDGTTVVAHVKDHPDQHALAIPRDDNGNHIADEWENNDDTKVRALAGSHSEDADDENDPVGDGTRGDGLTLYEEYRGFLENGRHTRGDPNKKDYFVDATSIGHVADGGIDMFEKAGKLAVHRLGVGELADRAINFNHGKAHVVDQHGVIVVPDKDAVWAQAILLDGPTGVGTPGMMLHVKFPIGYAAQNPKAPLEYVDSSLAHELFHTVDVSHHGAGDMFHVHWDMEVRRGKAVLVETVYDNATQKKGPAHVITAYFEDGALVPPDRYKSGKDFELGIKGGENSGDVDCVMRYDSAGAYVSQVDPNRRYIIVNEDPKYGTSLCTSPAGTGFNSESHKPESRFGSSSKHKACSQQIRVRDSP